MAALPCTLIYKLVVGVDKEPFPDGKMPAPLSGFVATQPGFKMPWQSVLTSDILRMVQVIPAGASDVLASESPGWLTAVNLTSSAAVWILRHGYPEDWEELLAALTLSGVAFGRYIPEAIVEWKGLHADDSNDIVALLCTVYGIGSLGYGIYRDSHNDRFKQPPGLMIANILTPLPSVFSWLTLSPIRLNVEAAPFAIGGNLLFDAVGYLGGGVELLLDTVQRIPKKDFA